MQNCIIYDPVKSGKHIIHSHHHPRHERTDPMKHLLVIFIAMIFTATALVSCSKKQSESADNISNNIVSANDAEIEHNITTEATASEISNETSAEQITAAQSDSGKSQNQDNSSAQATVSEGEDTSASDTLSADTDITLPGGKTIKISDIERVVLYTNNPNEPDPEVANTDSIIRVLSALSKMELGEPETGGWVGGNTIVIYSGGERFSQIAISEDEIYLVDSMDDNTKGVYPIISGGLNYDEWKALFADNE